MSTYLVNSIVDTTGSGTLRSAIAYANANAGTTITFDSSIAGQSITLTHELPLILGNGTVIDGGTNNLTISGADKYRAFFIGTRICSVSPSAENLTTRRPLAKGS